ncbi:MAG: DUF4189 domain-containing protein [Pseudomonadota bacterium]
MRALLLTLLLALSLGLRAPATAFVVEGPDGTAETAKDNLERAPRWPLSIGSFLESGERGLGGGLEYALDGSLCRLNFIDGATCDDARRAIQDALKVWSAGHPLIEFVDVTGRVTPDYPRRAQDNLTAGAEIDFFATSPRGFQAFSKPSINGYTVFYDEEHPSLVLTNGQIAPGPIGTITGADVHFNRSSCYYLDPSQGQTNCVHFPSLVLHEISHVLGIGHPEDRVGFNLDTDDQPGNEINIDCRAPLKGLKASANYDGASVAHGQDVHRPGRWLRGLSWDDVAARDALYPHCAIQRIERAEISWGAFVIGSGGVFGQSRLARSTEEAEATAQNACRESSTDCTTVSTFRDCFAFAANNNGAYGHAVSPRSDHARVDATLACSERGPDCRVITDFCAYD